MSARPVVAASSSPATDELRNRILGTIYGNCIGDAIGLLTEFMSKEEVEVWYPKANLEYSMKVDNRHQNRWKTGDWTDDSDQMILILQSLLENKGKVIPTDFAKRMINWGNHGFKELGDRAGLGIGQNTHKVLKHKLFTTDPPKAAEEVWRATGGQSAPNGAIMRTSILGIHQYQDIGKVIDNTITICTTTHADPRCVASCVAVTTAIAQMLQMKHHRALNGSIVVEGIIEDSYHYAKVYLPDDEDRRNVLHEYMNCRNLRDLKLDEPGEIGYTYKCLGAGFWALRQKDYRGALTAIAKEGGDADTNGAVAGALLGCNVGYDKLPTSWRDELRHKGWLDKMVETYILKVLPNQSNT
ncbi:ADP-ribosylarginine hydrolase Tri1-like [Glandiceps talaboti]